MKVVEQRCTCGAVLPEGARFCHKCGKPQYEEDIIRLAQQETPVAAPAATAPPVSATISFKNGRAVAISAAVAAVAMFGSGITAMLFPGFWPVILLLAGFLSARIYRGRSTQPLSGAAGARIGWMTGLWLFAVLTFVGFVFTLYVTSAAGADMMKQLKSMPQFSQLNIASPHDLVRDMLTSAIPTFFITTIIPGFGGLLGARLLTKNKAAS